MSPKAIFVLSLLIIALLVFGLWYFFAYRPPDINQIIIEDRQVIEMGKEIEDEIATTTATTTKSGEGLILE